MNASVTEMKARNYSTDAEKNAILHKLREAVGGTTITSKQLTEFVKTNNIPYPHFINNDKGRSVKWGVYNLSPIADVAPSAAPLPVFEHDQNPLPADGDVFVPGKFIPEPDPTFVPHGFYEDLKMIVKSDRFFPTLITGDSGNGKTLGVMQACAEEGKDCIRINNTKDTDESDYIGGYELVKGETVWKEGAAILAYRIGAKLLLDEVDYACEKILCIQSIMEGKPIFCKKRKIMIYPKKGFSVFATANTKGRGDLDGRYVGANVLNDAFLERFPITVEQGWPTEALEKKMLVKNVQLLGLPATVENDAFMDVLIKWAKNTRETHAQGGISDQISTRRLVHIINAYSLFENRDKAVRMCLNRFEKETQVAIFDLYKKVDDVAQKVKEAAMREKVASEVKTNKGQGSQASDIKFMSSVAALKKAFNTEITANEFTDANGVKNIAVASHGYTSTKAMDAMGKPGTPEFDKIVKGMVETNSARASLEKNRTGVKPKSDAEKAKIPF
jgi:MoxR-like ATPase